MSLTLVGALVGYLLAHPYTMFIYLWAHEHKAGANQPSILKLFAAALDAFRPVMLPMALSFALFGAVVGFLVGMLGEKKRKLREAELESQQKRVAFETLHQLTVTLSHYLLNADTIIAGTVRHCQRRGSLDKDVRDGLETINEQARKIEAVVRALQKVREIRTAQYTADSTVLMLDVTREMEEALQASNAEGMKNRE